MAQNPELPIAISLVTGRYLLFSVDAVSYIRREHRICGVLIGSIPQIPQQNIFLGLPLELMPEEARLLVEKGVAYVVDDARAHDEGLQHLERDREQRYLTMLKREGEQASKEQVGRKAERREKALKKRGLNPTSTSTEGKQAPENMDHDDSPSTEQSEQSIISPSELSTTSSLKSLKHSTMSLTPATSQGILPTPPRTPSPFPLPEVPSSYPLFSHLHSRGYFLSPGLRFGCQYMAYPGDPLRFHSHFLAVGVEWEQEIDLMDVVGGGRLGTGVKKGYLIGGAEPQSSQSSEKVKVRTFSVEWAGM